MVIKRLILLLFIFTTSLLAKEEIKILSTVNGNNLSLKLIIDSQEVQFKSNTNYYERIIKNAKAGYYKAQSKNQEYLKLIALFTKDIKRLEKTLQLGGSTLSKLYPVKHHNIHIQHKNFIISIENPFYEKYMEVIKKLMAQGNFQKQKGKKEKYIIFDK